MHFYDPFNKQPTKARTGARVADEQAGFSLLWLGCQKWFKEYAKLIPGILFYVSKRWFVKPCESAECNKLACDSSLCACDTDNPAGKLKNQSISPK